MGWKLRPHWLWRGSNCWSSTPPEASWPQATTASRWDNWILQREHANARRSTDCNISVSFDHQHRWLPVELQFKNCLTPLFQGLPDLDWSLDLRNLRNVWKNHASYLCIANLVDNILNQCLEEMPTKTKQILHINFIDYQKDKKWSSTPVILQLECKGWKPIPLKNMNKESRWSNTFPSSSYEHKMPSYHSQYCKTCLYW